MQLNLKSDSEQPQEHRQLIYCAASRVPPGMSLLHGAGFSRNPTHTLAMAQIAYRKIIPAEHIKIVRCVDIGAYWVWTNGDVVPVTARALVAAVFVPPHLPSTLPGSLIDRTERVAAAMVESAKLPHDSPCGHRKLKKTTIIIWSEPDTPSLELVDLAQAATDGDSFCSVQEDQVVLDPSTDPDFTPTDFFLDEDLEEDDDREQAG